MAAGLRIRPATVDDAGLILRFIRELAIYEKAEASVQTDEAGIRASLFGADAKAQALVCERNGVAMGYAVFFYNYSTWLGRNGIYLEDLYVSPEQRGCGAGKALLQGGMQGDAREVQEESKGTNNALQGELETMRERLVAAEQRAAVAEALAEERGNRLDQLVPLLPKPTAIPAADTRPWWRRLF